MQSFDDDFGSQPYAGPFSWHVQDFACQPPYSTSTTTNAHLVNASVEPRYISLFTPYFPRNSCMAVVQYVVQWQIRLVSRVSLNVVNLGYRHANAR